MKMSTIGYDSWAVDLANVGAVYPFQGAEVLMTVVGVVFWLGWHVIQHRRETADLEHHARINDKARITKNIERY